MSWNKIKWLKFYKINNCSFTLISLKDKHVEKKLNRNCIFFLIVQDEKSYQVNNSSVLYKLKGLFKVFDILKIC